MVANIQTINCFDSEIDEEQTVYFSWTDKTFIPRFITCIIKYNETLIYKKEVETISGQGTSSFVIRPYSKDKEFYSSSFQNGTEYDIWITGSMKSDGNSDKLTVRNATKFQCIKTPTFVFSNLEGAVLEGTGYNFKFVYHQDNGVPLEQLTLKIRANTQAESIIYTVPVTDASMNMDNNALVEFYVHGLKKELLYYVEALGRTSGGMKFRTGVHAFTPYYSDNQPYQFMNVQNLPEAGGIKINTNVISVDGELYRGDEVVITEDFAGKIIPDSIPYVGHDMLDLTEDYYLSYRKGYSINGNFSLVLLCTSLTPNKVIAEFRYKSSSNPVVEGTLYYREGFNGTPDYHGYFEYVIKSTYSSPRSNGTTNTTTTYRTYRNGCFYKVNNERWVNCDWKSYKEDKWKDFEKYTWTQLLVGMVEKNRMAVILSRKDNNYSLDAVFIEPERSEE